MDRRHTVVNSRRGYVQSSTLLLLSNLYKAPAASTASQSGSFQRPNHPPARYQKLCMVTQRKLWAHDTRHRRGERQGLFILMNPVNSLRVPPDRQRTHFLSAQKRDRVNFQGPRRRLGRLQSLRHRATWSQRVRTDVDQHGYAVDVLGDVYAAAAKGYVGKVFTRGLLGGQPYSSRRFDMVLQRWAG
jgi:hypothetical protein